MKDAIMYIVIIAAILAVVYGFWCLGRIISYELMYESLVIETIQEQVKASSLIITK